MYYHINKDRFDPKLYGEMLRVSDDIVSAAISDKDEDTYGLWNAFLSNILDYGHHHWQFQINKNDVDGFKYIGIWNTEIDANNWLNEWLQEANLSDGKAAYYGVNFECG